MEINIIKDEKNEIEIEVGNLTIAEILRVYLNKDSSVVFAAWKRDHPTEKARLLVKTKSKTAKKAINDAVSEIENNLDNILKNFKNINK